MVASFYEKKDNLKMFSLLNKIRFIVAFTFFIFMIQCTTSSPLENDRLAQMIDRLDRMQTKMDAENDKWTRKISDLEAEIEKLKKDKLDQDEELQNLKKQISHPKSSVSARKSDDGQSPRVPSSPPTSCQDLKDQNGKILPMDGIHLLKKNNKIQAALCSFSDDDSLVVQETIGTVDVKTEIVHFYVQRNSSFKFADTVVPFHLARLNEGDAFNLPTGIFTAPVPGIYHFDFSAAKSSTDSSLTIHLQVNGENVGRGSWFDKGNPESSSLSASFRLAAGDRVNVYLEYHGMLYDSSDHYTHFTGWLVEEELV